MLDLIIRGATVYDGSGAPACVADVAVKDGVIAAVGEVSGQGREEIDGAGLALAPGFIDTHTHSDYQVFFDPSRLCKLRQGVTLEIGGQCGWSRGPADPQIPPAAYDYLSTVNNRGNPITLYPTYNALLDAIAQQRPGAHQVCFVGHHVLRGSVVGMENRPPTAEELERMKALLDAAMREGAPGFSTGLVYAPGCYAATEEIIALAEVAARYGGIYTSHIRDEADRLTEAVGEAIRVARETGVRVNISHLKAMYHKNQPKLDEVIRMIEEANADGCDIFFDVYPYDAASATILSTLPPSYLSRDMDWLVTELSSPAGIDRLEKAIMEPTEVWENPMLNAGFDRDLIVTAKATPDAEGKTIRQYAVETGLRDVEAYAQIIAKNRGRVTDVRFVMEEESLERLYRHPLCTLGTDGLYMGGPGLSHPRAFGSFPRYLGTLIRDRNILSREEGIRRITGLPADRYHLRGKGYIREGYDADLVLFDWARLKDRATYTEPFLPNEGIEMVFVGGQAAVVNNQPTGIYNGKVYKPDTLRHPQTEKKYAFPNHNRPAALLLALLLMFGSLCACASGDAVVPESSSVVSISSAVDPEPPVPQPAAPGTNAGMLDGKKIIFVGCSYAYYGGVVIQDAYSVHSQEERANDQGYFYQLCKANGAEVSVMDWCYGGHDLSDLFDGHCDANQTELGYDHLADLTDRYYDYVVLQEIQVPEDWTAEQYRDNVVGIMDVFRAANPDTRFFYVIHNGVTGSYPTAWKESVKLIEEAGAVLVDWGNLVWDLRKGNVDVPGSDTVFRKNSFVVSQSKADGYHPNLLSGYLSALMTYCAITGETAVGQPVSFYNDASADPYFDVEKFLEKYYSWDNPATSEDERATNFVEIFESEADLKGLQMLADAYLDMECKFHTEYKATFREPDGRIIKSLSYRYGDKVKAPAMTEETFIGWKKTENPDTGELVYTAIYRKP